MRRQLHAQIFGALVVTGLLCALAASLTHYLLRDSTEHMPGLLRDVGAFIVDELPRDDPRAFEAGLRRRAKRLHASISVWNERGQLVARAGRPLYGPHERRHRKPFWKPDHALLIKLSDGRSVAVAIDNDPFRFGPARLLFALVVMAVALLLGTHWAARRIACRLEALAASVARFGRGELDARASEHGGDEIARLASAFNQSAARIGGLMRAQRRMLQSASHELRSPLSRLRMAHELLSGDELDARSRHKLALESARDIEELDALIGDLLLAARLEDPEQPKSFASVDLWTLVQEEAERVKASAHGSACSLHGDPRMLRSLVRNLLENARRYGRDPIEIEVSQAADQVTIRVQDRGDGVNEADRERIFEPFYRPQGHREGKDGGVGLGLSLVKSIAAHHGGSVRYVARGGAGSLFEVTLTRRAPEVSELTARTASSAGA